MFDFLTGTKRPANGTPVLPADGLRAALLAAARPSAPWRVVDGRSDGVDLVAEWRIVDAKWYEIFAKAGLEKSFRILMKFDEASHELRAQDREYEISWRAGVPSMSLAASGFKGQTSSIEFGKAYGFTEKGTLGEIYNYHFATSEIKKPLQQAVLGAGWSWKPVSFGKL